MDRYLTFDFHIDQLVGKCTSMLLALSHVKHCLPPDIIELLVTCLVISHISDTVYPSTALLVTCLVISHIRYLIISIYGTSCDVSYHISYQIGTVYQSTALMDRPRDICSIKKKLLNFCARVVCGVRKYDHISAQYKQLGWLHAEQLTL